MLRESRIQTVVLTVQYSTRSSYYIDWLDAFRFASQFEARAFNIFKQSQRKAAAAAIEKAELIVALHACSADTLDYIKPLSGALNSRRGKLLMLVGNEYNLPWAGLAEKRVFLRQVRGDFIGTQLPVEAGHWLYDDIGATVLPLPHALNERVFRRDKPDTARATDIGGRSARYPVFLGDDERNRVYDTFAEVGPKAGLRVDIETMGRLDRPRWAAFLNDCRGTIGNEAGSWYLERDDRTAREIREYIAGKAGRGTLRADGLLHMVSRRLPFHLKEALKGLLKRSPLRHEAINQDAVSFEEIWARFFAGRPRCPAYSKCISSRHFDAAGTGTCQILLRGRYNDILQADRHYIALDPDLGNLREVIERFRDATERSRVAEAAYTMVHDGHTYRHRLAALHSMVSAA
jgi:Glycosyl transferases group 1